MSDCVTALLHKSAHCFKIGEVELGDKGEAYQSSLPAYCPQDLPAQINTLSLTPSLSACAQGVAETICGYTDPLSDGFQSQGSSDKAVTPQMSECFCSAYRSCMASNVS